jgi:cyclic pyranopterin phosphate synthase
VVRAVLDEDVHTDVTRRAFVRVRLSAAADASGRYRASLAGGQGSHVLSALAVANGLAIVPEGTGALAAGAEGHVDRLGRPRMVDVTAKPATARRAVAEATVKMDQETLTLVIDGSGPKGDVMSVAELAGIMAAKRTADLIPLCHPLPLSDVSVEITPDRKSGMLVISASAATTAQTGVEMEAMTAASVAALTVYDMVKGADRFVTITNVRLMEKDGGSSGHWRRPAPKEAASTDAAPVQARPGARARRPRQT